MIRFGSMVLTPNNRLGLNRWRWLRMQPHRRDPQFISPLRLTPGYRAPNVPRKYGVKE